MDEPTIKKGKTLTILSYLWFFGALITMSINSEDRNEYASFHIRQSLGLCLSSALLGYVIILFDNAYVTLGFWGFFFLMWLYGFLGALLGKYHLVPVFGIFFQKFFKRL